MKISKEKKKRIKEQILSFLFHEFPKTYFTAQIAREIARDEEFTKDLLQDLKKDKIVTPIKKNPEGIEYSRRIRWRLSKKAHRAYKGNK
ncbi:MAG: hypothetical protein ACOC1P_06050 [Minisyncoccales bacterium]